MPGATAKICQSPTHASDRKKETPFYTPDEHPALPKFITNPSVSISLDSDEEDEDDLEKVRTQGHLSATPQLQAPFLQTFRDASLFTPTKNSSRVRNRDSSLVVSKLLPGRRRGIPTSCAKNRSPSPESSDSSAGSNELFYSCNSSCSPLRKSPPRISLSGLASTFRTPSHSGPSKRLSPATPAPAQSTKPHVLTPDSTHLHSRSTQPEDAFLRPARDLIRSASPDVKPTLLESTGLLTPEPTPDREKLQCQGLTGGKVQCRRWKANTEGAVYFCKSHQTQAESPLAERISRAKQEEIARSDKPGQCQGLTRRRVQCRSPSATGPEESNKFCFHHQNQQHRDRPGLGSLVPKTENGADDGGNLRRASTSGAALDYKKPGDIAKTNVKAVVQGRQTIPIKQNRSILAFDTNIEYYIPSYMTGKARKDLLAKMKKRETHVSEGYVYICEVTAKDIKTRSEKHMYVKVGCSGEPGVRVVQWQGSCTANTFEPHGVWPRLEDPQNGSAANSRNRADPYLYKGLLERLIKHEMKYLAESSAHLSEDERPMAPAREKCPCETPPVMHNEIYAIARYGVKDGGENDQKLWDMIDGIAQKWSEFVLLYHKKPRRLSACVEVVFQNALNIVRVLLGTAFRKGLKGSINIGHSGRVSALARNPKTVTARVYELRFISVVSSHGPKKIGSTLA